MVKAIFSTILILGCYYAQAQPHIENHDAQLDYIEWTAHYNLGWNDFQGKPGLEAIGDAGTAVAIKAKPYMVKNKISYHVRALFIKTKSWYREQSPALLAHEQLHFDIAELYARKARKKIRELSLAGVKDIKVYNQEIQKILNESNAVDQRYDTETLHGAMVKKQKEWADRVKAGLLTLEQFKGQHIDI